MRPAEGSLCLPSRPISACLSAGRRAPQGPPQQAGCADSRITGGGRDFIILLCS